MSGRDLLRYLFLSVLLFAALLTGLKIWGKQNAERRVVRELRAVLNPASQFEQLYAKDAEKDLLRAMATLRQGATKLGREPGEILNMALRGKGKGALFENPDPGQDRYYTDPRETLIRESILRNYQRCLNLGAFESAANLKRMEDGDPPEILSGPSTGKTARITHIIDPALSPGVEKLIPNMILDAPAGRTPAARPSDLQIKQAKDLATLMLRAQLIEQAAEQRLLDHYDALAEAGTVPAGGTP